MLSKIKSPALAERHSPHAHRLHGKLIENLSETQDRAHENQKRRAASPEQDDKERRRDENENENDDSESQHTATDLVIDQSVAQAEVARKETEEPAPRGPEDEAQAVEGDQGREGAPEVETEAPVEHLRSPNDDNNNNQMNGAAHQERRHQESETNNNNNNNDVEPLSQQNSGKRSQVELLDIIETSRKRRLSKDSADSLSSFIRWSFSHFDANSIFGLNQSRARRSAALRAPTKGAMITRHHNRHQGSTGSDQSDMKEDEEEEEEDFVEEFEVDLEDRDEDDDGERHLAIADEDTDGHRERHSSDEPADLVTDLRRQQQRRQQLGQQSDPIKFTTERVLRNRAARLAGSSAPDSQANSRAPNGALNGTQATNLSMATKRSRQAGAYSPEPHAKVFSPAAAKTSPAGHHNNAQLNFALDRLSGRQGIKSLDQIASQLGAAGAKRQQHFARAPLDLEPPEEAESERSGAASGISLQLQHFLQQQHQQQLAQRQRNSPPDERPLALDQEELSPGSRQSSQQLALAAAIHRALLGNNSGGSGASGQHNSAELLKSAGQSNGSLLMDSLSRQRQEQHATTPQPQQQQQQQRPRTYNTRGLAQAAANLASNRLQQQQMAISNRVALMQQQQQQQQRHAQAAAALSVLANGANPSALQHFAAAAAAAAAGQAAPHLANSHGSSANAFQSAQASGAGSHHNLHLSQQQQQHQRASGAGLAVSGLGVNSAAAAAGALASPASLAALASQTEFKCDTCPSSFDDRHRLMQHQSIHLELKKDWFNETPVEEVMKIFNRRRGEFLCNLCNLRFEATLDYDQHNHQVHGPRPYCCQFCGNGTRTFKCWRQYLNHLYDHRYIFSCTIGDCDFTVNRRDSLRFHIFRFHLNCQLPQNQQVTPTNGFKSSAAGQLSPYNLSASGALGAHNGFDQDHFGGGGGGGGGPLAFVSHHNQLQMQRWPSMMEDEGEDTDNEMNVAD